MWLSPSLRAAQRRGNPVKQLFWIASLATPSRNDGKDSVGQREAKVDTVQKARICSFRTPRKTAESCPEHVERLTQSDSVLGVNIIGPIHRVIARPCNGRGNPVRTLSFRCWPGCATDELPRRPRLRFCRRATTGAGWAWRQCVTLRGCRTAKIRRAGNHPS